jgi:DNA replication protein DnaC
MEEEIAQAQQQQKLLQARLEAARRIAEMTNQLVKSMENFGTSQGESSEKKQFEDVLEEIPRDSKAKEP